MLRSHIDDKELNSLLKQFWSVEAVSSLRKVERRLTSHEILAVKKVKELIKFAEGKYEVAVPWKEGKHQLPSNWQMAENRLRSVERKMKEDKDLAQPYEEVIDE